MLAIEQIPRVLLKWMENVSFFTPKQQVSPAKKKPTLKYHEMGRTPVLVSPIALKAESERSKDPEDAQAREKVSKSASLLLYFLQRKGSAYWDKRLG